MFALSSFWNPESFTEQSELSEFFLAKSRSAVITLQFYRPRSQLLGEGIVAWHEISCCMGSWDLGSISWDVLATAMREVRTCCIWEEIWVEEIHHYSRYSKTLLRYPRINLSWKPESSCLAMCLRFMLKTCESDQIWSNFYLHRIKFQEFWGE